jgi:hypothetical protein
MNAERQPTDPVAPETPPVDAPTLDAQAAAESPAIDRQPVTTPPPQPPAADTPAEPEVAAPVAAAPVRSSRRGAVARGGLRFMQFVIGVGLFVVGVYLGTLAFQAAQRDPLTAGVGAVSGGVPTPPVVQEFASALGSGGADAVRSSVSPEVFALLASELKRWQFNSISKVEVLSTAADGPRTATGIVMTGPTSAGTTLSMNLIVQTDGGRITTLR